MKTVYLDNAATTFPKPPGVADAVTDYITRIGVNINRGGYEQAYQAADMVLETRELLARLFHFSAARNVVFTANATTALNLLLKGLLRPGDHVLVSSLEHNAVMRPLTQLTRVGVDYDRIPCDRDGVMNIAAVPRLLQSKTRAVVVTHASNVGGTVHPLQDLGEICAGHELRFIVDSSQTAGVLPIDMKAMQIDGLAFTGHKGLLGPQGIGGMIISDALAAATEPLLAGGTGSYSHLLTMPEKLPDRYEAGTLNLPGIAGLRAALKALNEAGIGTIGAHEQRLADLLIEGVDGLPGVRVLGRGAPSHIAVVSMDFIGRDNAEIAFRLESEYGILTRCGLHCAPEAHRAYGTFPRGTVRFSPGMYTTEKDILFTVQAIGQVLSKVIA